MQKIRTPHQHSEGKVFAWLSLSLGFANGLIAPVFPGFVKDILKSDQLTSIFFFSTAIVMLIACISSTIVFRKINRTALTKVSIIALGFALFFLIFVTDVIKLALTTAVIIWFDMFLVIAIGLFVRDFSRSKGLGREEGVHYKFQNIGIFFGPFIGGFISARLSQELSFITAAAMVFSTFAYFLHKELIDKNPIILNAKKVSPEIVFKNFKIFFSNSHRIKSYFVTLGYMTWVRFVRIYVPLYVIAEGYLDSMSGLILALSILPAIFLEVKIGEYGDKSGMKMPIVYGFTIIGLSAILIFVNPIPLINFILIITAGLGAAMIEPMQEPMLFKALPAKDEDQLYGVYMTADSIAYFLAPAIAALALLFAPLKSLFLIFGLLMIFMALFSHLNLKYSSPEKLLQE
ncbi:MFS transporter [Candidatus Peregrinibacteria bacterium]|nr:MFS transporter [Candidatus Peregrinibacteria bacterium]